MITASVKGQLALSAKLLKMQVKTPGLLQKALAKAAEPIRDYAIGAALVATGGLARSITIRPVGDKDPARAAVRIGPAWSVYNKQGVVEYGKFQEYGTSEMAAQPFLRPALDAGKDEAIDRLKAEIKKALT